jgi:hypothetical protein
MPAKSLLPLGLTVMMWPVIAQKMIDMQSIKPATAMALLEQIHVSAAQFLIKGIGMKPDRPVGIVGYGAYVPRYRIAAKDISQVWTGGHGGVPVESKSVPADEDVITMSLEAAERLETCRYRPQRFECGMDWQRIAPL